MSSKLLSIIIPTYNRGRYLEKLLGHLLMEIRGLERHVNIFVANNCSTDNTAEVVAIYAAKSAIIKVLNRGCNVGPDENFAACVESDTSEYFWLLGDDDLPRAGLIAGLVEILDTRSPDLVCMRDVWMTDIYGKKEETPIGKLNVLTLDAINYARVVNARMTFMSVTIIKRKSCFEVISVSDLRRYFNSNLIHLGWILPVLNSTNNFLYIQNESIYATAGNTGGYSAIKVFLKNFPEIVDAELGVNNQLSKAIKVRSMLRVVISIGWALRNGTAGNFSIEESRRSITVDAIGWGAYVLISCIINSSILIAYPFRMVLSVIYMAIKHADIVRAKLYSALN